jgi:peptidoglycan/LPS O-acetylase OafA/YrhL
MASMHYRREIDGLRAIAVIPVIFFHAGFSSFGGGFFGVDIFFVISGYLITHIILANLATEQFSIIDFYGRRARRILPALFLILFTSTLFAYAWLLPSDLRNFSDSILAVIGFYSNFFFWKNTGYFTTQAEMVPLLHTWSLAVEEQFYLFFPFLLKFCWQFARSRLLVIIFSLTLLSFFLAQWGATHKPEAAFYLLPGRCWELTLGALLTIIERQKPMPIDTPPRTQILSLLGLIFILASVILYNANSPPGIAILPPIVGTGLIIHYASSGTWTARILSLRPLTLVGQISYSAYLWHQPLFAFCRHRSLHELNKYNYSLLIIICFALAWLTWRWVERPFRNKIISQREHAFTIIATAMSLLLVLGALGHYSHLHFRHNSTVDDMARLEKRIRMNFGLSEHCDSRHNQSSIYSTDCRTNDRPEVILWGDSYAMHLAQGLISSNPGIALVQATRSICGPILDTAPVVANHSESWMQDCLATNNQVLQYIRNSPSIKYVVLSSPFDRYLASGNRLLLADGHLVVSGEAGLSELQRTVNVLKDIGVIPVIVAPPPVDGEDLGRCLVRASLSGVTLDRCNFSIERISPATNEVYHALARLKPEVKIISLHDAMCVRGICRAAIGQTFLYRDSGHLSYEGSALLGRKLQLYRAITGTIPPHSHPIDLLSAASIRRCPFMSIGSVQSPWVDGIALAASCPA